MITMQKEEEMREHEEREMMERKRQLVLEAERIRDEPVDDSKLVDKMFDFLPDSASESQAPPVSRRSRWEVIINILMFI